MRTKIEFYIFYICNVKLQPISSKNYNSPKNNKLYVFPCTFPLFWSICVTNNNGYVPFVVITMLIHDLSSGLYEKLEDTERVIQNP